MNRNCLRENRRRSGILSFALVIIFGATAFSQETEVKPLFPNQTIEREMTGAETHRYKFELKADEFFQVDVQQKAINVTLRLYDSKGNELITSEDSKILITTDKTLSLSYITTTGSTYFLDVVPSASIALLNNSFKLERKPSRIAADDEKKIIADLLIKKGSESSNKNLAKQAIVQYQNALSLYESLRNDNNSIVGMLICNRTLRAIYFGLKDNVTAIKYFEKTFDLLTKFKKQNPNADLKVLQTILFNDLGKAYFAEGQEEKALTYLNQIDFEDLNYWNDKKDILKDSLDTLFNLYVSLGDVEDYDKSIQIFNKLINYFNNQPVEDFKYNDVIPPEIYKDFYICSLYLSLAKAYTEAGYYLNAVSSNKKGLEINLSIQEKLKVPRFC